jgi:hypothetical protein
MAAFLRGTVTLAVAFSWSACLVHAQRADEHVNPDAAVLQDFQSRLKKYMELRDQLQDRSLPFKETDDPAEISAARTALAEKLRIARKGARQGEIFTPEVATKFRRLMYPELKGKEGRDTKAAIKEDAPAPAQVALKVNAAYPEKSPLPTVPPNVLINLPRLPEQLEYRIVDRHLILRDVDANLIVDFIPNAIR